MNNNIRQKTLFIGMSSIVIFVQSFFICSNSFLLVNNTNHTRIPHEVCKTFHERIRPLVEIVGKESQQGIENCINEIDKEYVMPRYGKPYTQKYVLSLILEGKKINCSVHAFEFDNFPEDMRFTFSTNDIDFTNQNIPDQLNIQLAKEVECLKRMVKKKIQDRLSILNFIEYGPLLDVGKNKYSVRFQINDSGVISCGVVKVPFSHPVNDIYRQTRSYLLDKRSFDEIVSPYRPNPNEQSSFGERVFDEIVSPYRPNPNEQSSFGERVFGGIINLDELLVFIHRGTLSMIIVMLAYLAYLTKISVQYPH
jgi:hypothetical protein